MVHERKKKKCPEYMFKEVFPEEEGGAKLDLQDRKPHLWVRGQEGHSAEAESGSREVRQVVNHNLRSRVSWCLIYKP